MAKKIFHVSFHFKNGDNRHAEIKALFDKAKDWCRYTPTCWLLYTTLDVHEWYNRIKPILKDGDNVFIVAVDLKDRQGWVSRSTWDWINKTRSFD